VSPDASLRLPAETSAVTHRYTVTHDMVFACDALLADDVEMVGVDGMLQDVVKKHAGKLGFTRIPPGKHQVLAASCQYTSANWATVSSVHVAKQCNTRSSHTHARDPTPHTHTCGH
jgi:hypothetical protein